MQTLVLLLTSTLLFAQPDTGVKERDPKGKENYTKYEKEDVSQFRDRVVFTLPEPNVVVKEEEVELEPESLAGYFQDGNTVHIQTDPQLYEWIELDKENKNNTNEVSGFRIQIYSGSSRDRAFRLNAGVMSRFRNRTSYLKYNAPNYIVRMGDFMDKEEAILFVREVRRAYPGAFIVPDKVKVPKYNPNWEEDWKEESPLDDYRRDRSDQGEIQDNNE